MSGLKHTHDNHGSLHLGRSLLIRNECYYTRVTNSGLDNKTSSTLKSIKMHEMLLGFIDLSFGKTRLVNSPLKVLPSVYGVYVL